jgi:poly(ADP-ribose) glycohydrolase ARH3
MENIDLQDKIMGTIFGSAIGDALGAPFEGTILVYYEMEPYIKLDEIPVLKYTDDFHMTLGLAQSLIRKRAVDLEDIAKTWALNIQAEPNRRYSKRTREILNLINEGKPVDDKLRDSFGNGSAMRVSPLPILITDTEELKKHAYEQSSITHTNELAKEGSYIQALAISMALSKDSKEPIYKEAFLTDLEQKVSLKGYKKKFEYMREYLPDPFEKKFKVVDYIGRTTHALDSVMTSIFSFLAYPDNFQDAVYYAVSHGGDADTIASMTGAISGAYLGYSKIPQIFIDKIENRPLLNEISKGLWDLRK